MFLNGSMVRTFAYQAVFGKPYQVRPAILAERYSLNPAWMGQAVDAIRNT